MDVIRALGYSINTTILCGMAIDYENKKHIVNSYRTPRKPLDNIIKYFS